MSETHQIRVPQMGEGLQYAKVVRILKNAGDWAEEDADVVEVETEKAILGISTPVAGFISAVCCRPGDMVNVGAVLLEIGAKSEVSAPLPFRQERKGARLQEKPPAAYDDGLRSLPDRQLALIEHMRVSQGLVIPASLEMQADWDAIDRIKRTCRAGGAVCPSATEILCWALSRAMQKFEKFRSRLTPDNRLQVNADSRIGIAVAGEDDSLDMRCAVIAPQDGLEAACGKTRDALDAQGPSGGYHSLSLSDMSSFQVLRAQPIVIYPAVATLFIGAPHWVPAQKTGGSRRSNFVLAFDHRVMNGVYAAKFLKEVEAAIRHLADQLSPEAGKVEENVAHFGT